MAEEYPDRIAELFKDKTLLITGVTGFVGKFFLEKVLRSCNSVKKVYVIIRCKYDKDPNRRLEETFENPMFDLLKKEQGDSVFNKVEAINGDMLASNLNLSENDRRKLCEEVDLIYHAASTIRFDLPLKESTLLNVRGTKFMVDLAKECQHLLLFMYVSTAFCQVNESVLEEKTYDPPKNPHIIIKICEYLDTDVVAKIHTDLLGNHPNTYSFTKALSEGLVNEKMDCLPAIIVRPSIVVPVMYEPIKGYNDNINGPFGLLVAAGKGVCRTIYTDGDAILDYMPVDILASCMIFVTFDYLTQKGLRKVYNLVGKTEIKLEEWIEDMRTCIKKYPFNTMLWYPDGQVTHSKLIFYFKVFMFQLVPALFLDFLLLLAGQKPFLIKVQKKIFYGYKLFAYYLNRNWNFNNEMFLKATRNLNPLERKKYKLEIENSDLTNYILNSCHCARVYILKETDDRLPAARRLLNIMWMIDIFFKGLLLFGVIYYIHKKITTVNF